MWKKCCNSAWVWGTVPAICLKNIQKQIQNLIELSSKGLYRLLKVVRSEPGPCEQSSSSRPAHEVMVCQFNPISRYAVYIYISGFCILIKCLYMSIYIIFCVWWLVLYWLKLGVSRFNWVIRNCSGYVWFDSIQGRRCQIVEKAITWGATLLSPLAQQDCGILRILYCHLSWKDCLTLVLQYFNMYINTYSRTSLIQPPGETIFIRIKRSLNIETLIYWG